MGVRDIYRNRAVGRMPVLRGQEPSRYPALASDANLLAWLPMEGVNTGLTNTDITYSSGIIGKAAVFDGDSSKILTTAYTGITGNAVFSYMMWILPTAVNALQVICDSGFDMPLQAAAVCIDLASAGDLGVAFAGGNSATTAGGVLTAGIWQHIAITKAAGAINTTLSFYVNGISIPLAAGAPTGTPNITNRQLQIGCTIVFASPFWYAGAIDDFFVFNRVITGQEISEYLEWCKNVW